MVRSPSPSKSATVCLFVLTTSGPTHPRTVVSNSSGTADGNQLPATPKLPSTGLAHWMVFWAWVTGPDGKAGSGQQGQGFRIRFAMGFVGADMSLSCSSNGPIPSRGPPVYRKRRPVASLF